MPITSSAKKALRQSQKHKTKNLQRKNAVKDLFKQLQKLVVQNQLGEAKSLVPKLYKAIDKAAKAGVLKKNTASRKKSRAARMAREKPQAS